jgi:monoamine oxidase
MARLEKIFGPEVSGALVTAKITDWQSDPDTYGAFSAARPGFHHMRAKLREPIEGGLYFAGEACHDEWAQCVPGAWLTGAEAAVEIGRDLVAPSRPCPSTSITAS